MRDVFHLVVYMIVMVTVFPIVDWRMTKSKSQKNTLSFSNKITLCDLFKALNHQRVRVCVRSRCIYALKWKSSTVFSVSITHFFFLSLCFPCTPTAVSSSNKLFNVCIWNVQRWHSIGMTKVCIRKVNWTNKRYWRDGKWMRVLYLHTNELKCLVFFCCRCW